MQKTVMALVVACSLTACQTVYRTSEQVAEAVTVSTDKFKNRRTIRTPWMAGKETSRWSTSWDHVKYFIRYIDAGKGTRGSSHLYVRYTAPEWAFLHSAFLPGRRTLSTTQIDRDVGSGISEDLGIDLDAALVREILAIKKGYLEIMLYGKKRNCKLRVSPLVVQGFLQALSGNAATPPR